MGHESHHSRGVAWIPGLITAWTKGGRGHQRGMRLMDGIGTCILILRILFAYLPTDGDGDTLGKTWGAGVGLISRGWNGGGEVHFEVPPPMTCYPGDWSQYSLLTGFGSPVVLEIIICFLCLVSFPFYSLDKERDRPRQHIQ